MMYVIFLIAGVGFAAAAIAPRCVGWYHAALVQYETDCLVSNLRLLKQMTRTAIVFPSNEGIGDDYLSLGKPELDLEDNLHEYRIIRLGFSPEGVQQRQNLVIHHYPPQITVAARTKDTIDFGRDGSTLDITTIEVCYEGEQQKGKDVIIDIVGRIRVEEHHAK